LWRSNAHVILAFAVAEEVEILPQESSPTSRTYLPSPYEPLRVLMDRFGALGDPERFYWEVNDAYHASEASAYDDLHAGLFSGGAPLWRRLLRSLDPAARVHVLDVGSGTGNVPSHLARLAPDRIREVTLLDPSTRMLARSRAKAPGWPFPSEFVEGDVRAVAGRRFDVMTISSVLHHVVDLDGLADAARRLLPSGGLLLTMADPRGDAASDEVLRRRKARSSARHALRTLLGIGGRVLSGLGLHRPTVQSRATNELLRERGVVTRTMDAASIYAVTDFHVPGQPGGLGHGFSRDGLRSLLHGFELVDWFTYEYHGAPWHLLDEAERRRELEWFAADDGHGALFASAWRRL
jgi:ubiquinone/menaquinone biosynthesis C-methylase UbiE